MTARKLDNFGAEPVARGAPRPFDSEQLVIAANHKS
jgi:hypothetical protein